MMKERCAARNFVDGFFSSATALNFGTRENGFGGRLIERMWEHYVRRDAETGDGGIEYPMCFAAGYWLEFLMEMGVGAFCVYEMFCGRREYLAGNAVVKIGLRAL